MLLATLGLALGALTQRNSAPSTAGKDASMTTSSLLKDLGAALQGADLQPADCQWLYGRMRTGTSACWMSRVAPDALLKQVQAHLKPVGVTSGWSNDYGVWGAFYALNGQPGRTFGVTIKPIPGELEFEGVKAVQGYESFVTLTVNESATSK